MVDALPYFIPHVKDIDQELVQDLILKLLRQKNFSAETFSLVVAQTLEKYNKLDPAFWYEVISYVP
jgi:hypothetical protein